MREPGSIHALLGGQLWPPQSSGSLEGDLSLQVGKAPSQLMMQKSSLIIRSDEK